MWSHEYMPPHPKKWDIGTDRPKLKKKTLKVKIVSKHDKYMKQINKYWRKGQKLLFADLTHAWKYNWKDIKPN